MNKKKKPPYDYDKLPTDDLGQLNKPDRNNHNQDQPVPVAMNEPGLPWDDDLFEDENDSLEDETMEIVNLGRFMQNDWHQELAEQYFKLKDFLFLREEIIETAADSNALILAETQMYKKANALEVMNAFTKILPKEGQNSQALQRYLSTCQSYLIDALTSSELVHAFFTVLKYREKKAFDIKPFRQGADFEFSELEIKNQHIASRLQTGLIPIRVDKNPNRESLMAWINQSMQQNLYSQQLIFILVTKYPLSPDLRKLRLESRESARPKYIIELETTDFKRLLELGTGGMEFMERQFSAILKEDLNPYESSPTVTKYHEFFGRKQQILEINGLITKGRHFLLTGPQRSGKSSLLRVIEDHHKLNSDYLPVYFSLKNNNLPDFCLHLGREIFHSLKQRYPESQYPIEQFPELAFTNNPFYQQIHAAPENRNKQKIREDFTSSIKWLLERLKKRGELNFTRILLFLDEVDKMISRGNQSRENSPEAAFLSIIRELMDYHNLLLIGVSSVGPFAEKNHDRSSPVNDRFWTIQLGHLSREESDEMITKIGVNNLLFFDQASLHRIYQETAGAPLVIRRFGDILFKEFGRTGFIASKDVDAGIASFLTKHGHQTKETNYRSYFVANHPQLRELFDTLVRQLNPLAGIHFNSIKTFPNINLATVENDLVRLVELEMLEIDKSNQHYYLRSGFLHRYLRQYPK